MMDSMAVWKYELQPGRNSVKMPHGARLLHVHIQAGEKLGPGEYKGVIALWAEVDPFANTYERAVYVAMTGEEMPTGGIYVGTVHAPPLVMHVYDLGLDTSVPWRC